MLEKLPNFIDAKRLTLQNCHIKGNVNLAEMSRLHDSLYNQDGTVEIDWHFTTDEQHRSIITGKIQTTLNVLCQRCLQVMSLPIETKVSLMILNNEDQDSPKNYDPLILTNPEISLYNMIEDELLLALPIVSYHKSCSSNEYTIKQSDSDDLKENPFKILENLNL